MALHASIHENGISLEDELAEATKDLLDLGTSKQAINRFIKNDHFLLSSPSPLLLSRPESVDRLNVSKALSIDPNARIKPIHDDDNDNDDNIEQQKQDDLKSNNKTSKERLNDSMDSKTSFQSNLPSSNLHESVKAVSTNLLAPLVRKSVTSSPALQAVQDSLREHSWLNQYGERITSQGKIEGRMDLFNARVYPSSAGPSGSARESDDLIQGSRSAGPKVHRGSQQSHIPAFFQESFPEWIKNDKDGSQEEDIASSPKKKKEKELSISHSNSVPGHRLRSAQPSSAIATQESVMVKLHGNKRAERQAMLNESHLKDDQNFSGEMTLALDPSSPLQEIAPNPANDDNMSLISLSATAVTSSSNTSSARRRRSLARRRSNGSQSYMTGGSGEDGLGADVTLTPFARDVHIRGFSIVGEKARGYVAYDVRIVTHAGSTIGVLKRFSAFVHLRKDLIEECKSRIIPKGSTSSDDRTTSNSGNMKFKGQHRPIPQLPPKRSGILQKYASDHLERRRRSLQKWLSIIMLDPLWGTTHAVRQFVVGTDDV